jgi:hypothetical protein
MGEANDGDPLRTRREFCQQGKFGPKTLQRIEARGEGPPAIEITPGFVRYRQSAIDARFAARNRHSKPVGSVTSPGQCRIKPHTKRDRLCFPSWRR